MFPENFDIVVTRTDLMSYSFCKVCKKEVKTDSRRFVIRENSEGEHSRSRIYTQMYHPECFESVAGDLVNDIRICALCNKNVQVTNSRSTICSGCKENKITDSYM